MRARVVIISLCLLLAGTTFLPGVEARDPFGGSDDCQKPTSTGVHKACGKIYVVNAPYACIMGGYWTETGAGPVVYRQYHCGPDPR